MWLKWLSHQKDLFDDGASVYYSVFRFNHRCWNEGKRQIHEQNQMNMDDMFLHFLWSVINETFFFFFVYSIQPLNMYRKCHVAIRFMSITTEYKQNSHITIMLYVCIEPIYLITDSIRFDSNRCIGAYTFHDYEYTPTDIVYLYTGHIQQIQIQIQIGFVNSNGFRNSDFHVLDRVHFVLFDSFEGFSIEKSMKRRRKTKWIVTIYMVVDDIYI